MEGFGDRPGRLVGNEHERTGGVRCAGWYEGDDRPQRIEVTINAVTLSVLRAYDVELTISVEHL
jgi:hypothetical protein